MKKFWKHNVIPALWIALGYLLIFLAGKLLSDNPGLPLWQWLLDSSSVHYSYLYGWLISHQRMLYASLVAILPALFGKTRFAFTALFGFALGLPLGEFLGRSGIAHIHYGWAIWAFIYLISCIMGIVLQRFPKYEVTPRSHRFRIWLVVYLLLAAATVIYVRMNMP